MQGDVRVIKETQIMEAKEILQQYIDNPDNKSGFTLDLFYNKDVTSGWIVAYNETQNCTTDEAGIEKVLQHAMNNDQYIGGWLDEETGFFYLDSVRVYKNKELTEAIKFAKEQQQLCIYNVSTKRYIRI